MSSFLLELTPPELILDLKDGKQSALPFFKEEFELNWLLAKTGKSYVSVMDGVTSESDQA